MLNQHEHVRLICSGETGIILDVLDGDYPGYLIETDDKCDIVSCGEDEVELIK